MAENNYLQILDTMEYMTEKQLENSVTILKTKTIDRTRRVYVYFNLHKKVWSVRQDGKVLEHTKHIKLKDARFLVGKAGREKVLREKTKNVHAGISGYVVDDTPDVGKSEAEVTYNPYKYETFVAINDPYDPVEYADYVEMSCEDGTTSVWAIWT